MIQNPRVGMRVETHGSKCCMWAAADHPGMKGKITSIEKDDVNLIPEADHIWVKYDKPLEGFKGRDLWVHCIKCVDPVASWWHKPVIAVLRWATRMIQRYGLKPKGEST